MKTPYRLSKDYNELYILTTEYSDIPILVGSTWDAVWLRNGYLRFGFYTLTPIPVEDKDIFISECQRLNIQFIEP
jgi:hypothetical protein